MIIWVTGVLRKQLLTTDVSPTCEEAILRVKMSQNAETGFRTGCRNVSRQQQSL